MASVKKLNREECLETLRYMRDFLSKQLYLASGKSRSKWNRLYNNYFVVYGKYCLIRNDDRDLISYPIEDMQNDIYTYCKWILSLCKKEKINTTIEELIVVMK